MAYNQQSEVYLGLHESIFNRIIKHVHQQRPSLFNHATPDFLNNPSLFSQAINHHPAINQFRSANPIASEIKYLPIMGYEGPFGMSLCFQITDLDIDLHPNNLISNLNLAAAFTQNRFELRLKIAGGLACPSTQTLAELVRLKKRANQTIQGIPFSKNDLNSFTLEFFLIASLENQNNNLQLAIHEFEIKDISPIGMDKAMECFVMTQLRLGVIPNLKINLNEILSDIFKGVLPSLGFALAGRKPNPEIHNDKIECFFSLTSKN